MSVTWSTEDHETLKFVFIWQELAARLPRNRPDWALVRALFPGSYKKISEAPSK